MLSRRVLQLPIAVAVLGAAAMFAVRGEWPWTRLTDVPTARPIVVTNPFRIVRDTLQSGETVSALLARQGVTGLNVATLASVVRFDPRRIRAGLEFFVRRNSDTDEPTHVEFRPTPEQRVRFVRASSGEWKGEAVPIYWATDTIRVGAGIESNLYAAMDREVSEATLDHNERVRLVNELADVNEWTVDFSRDIQPGDRFAAVVERLVSEEGEVRFGRILASELVLGGKTLNAFRFGAAGTAAAFYDGEGKALKRSFLVTPVEFRYISSGFSRARFHPVLGIMRKHEGLDYAAATGTPVRAAGDGTVLRAGYGGGYGNLVEVRHRDGVTTRYGHLSRIATGLHPGMHVTQGQVIGRVGMTGLATGPHLHYEFRVDGVARDPRSIKSEAGAPLPGSSLASFRSQRDVLLQLLGRRAPGNSSPLAG
ncbi:MAG: M23 family metallopeptidase [Gemmatimonadota bacterium]